MEVFSTCFASRYQTELAITWYINYFLKSFQYRSIFSIVLGSMPVVHERIYLQTTHYKIYLAIVLSAAPNNPFLVQTFLKHRYLTIPGTKYGGVKLSSWITAPSWKVYLQQQHKSQYTIKQILYRFRSS